jgi:hypothetical protein
MNQIWMKNNLKGCFEKIKGWTSKLRGEEKNKK